ncbi:universal stress protein [Nonomuraea turcica]|uniref:universal stress protein n=1 Tax=Nonomuraea sp. G32 TaxID=3067274 RepID=UPI00273C087B|nr:universal stress protein [Nonomuraea sp. G32]MDP4510065.1 universal stress protein [Nonomuraea sp. G32]
MRDELGVVVGYEDSPSAQEALRWGAAEAVDRKLPLTVCHAWEWHYHEWPGELVPLELVRRPARRLVKAAAAWARTRYPELPVSTLTGRGSPAALLAELSREVELIVVGTRGYSALGGLVARSVSGHAISWAACPVIIVRGDAEARGAREVVVGFDGSRVSVAALGFAAGEAVRAGAPLKVLIAHHGRGTDAGVRESLIRAEGLAWEELAVWRRHHHDLQTSVELVDEPARPALLEAAWKARLLVVGTRGLGEVRGLLLRSVSQAMAHHAPCPVAVVHES